MDRQQVTPEQLPPLALRPMRDLDLEKVSGSPSHLSAASGIVRRGVFAYVIGDDLLDLGIFDLSGAGPGRLRQVLSGEPPADPDEAHRTKPDLESLTALPPFGRSPYGALLGLGSGSKSDRDRGFFWSFDADGSLRDDPHEIDFGPLYDSLRKELGDINIEGASVFGDRLWIFHRGNKGDAPNTVAELALQPLFDSLQGDLVVDHEELDEVRAYDLGELDGTDLCFSDASPLFDQLVVFTASAEVDSEGAEDGAIRGSVVGTIDAGGEVRRLREIDRRWKVEGVHAQVDTGVIDFAFVCDQDDPAIPSPLLTATMPIEPGFEAPV
jgi:hypothetical protein